MEYMTASTARWRGTTAVHDDHGMPRGPERPSEIVAASLRERIAAGEWESGEALPTVTDLAASYHVARATVTRVMRVLEAEGLIRVVPRWGTFRT
jgi:DNA-binding GntR family transcriptional regulator